MTNEKSADDGQPQRPQVPDPSIPPGPVVSPTPSSGGDQNLTPPYPSGQMSAETETIPSLDDVGRMPGRRARLAPGQRIGHYLIERRLGGGGMGEVYAAEHLDSGHRLAVKFLASSETWSSALRQRFLREGKLAATVNHPNSLYVYGTEEVDGNPLIAMELADGGTLQDRVQDKGPLPVTEAVDAILQIIAGLEAAFEAGILHRDVKPANCFVDRQGSVKIGDYGLSFPTADAEDTRLTIAGTILATPAFAPPEQLRGEAVDLRADIYAVGATLYNLLTGTTPLQAAGAMQMLAAVLEKSPESPRARRPEIPQGLAQVVLRCLEKKPADRYQSYPELRRALIEFSSDVPPLAPLRARIGAGILDWSLFFLLFVAAFFFPSNDISRQNDARDLLFWVVLGLIYALPEMLWGRSIGKKITGLRLVRRSGMKPDCRQVLMRSAIYLSPCVLLQAMVVLLPDGTATEEILGSLQIVAPLLLFAPWPRDPRRMGLHDRVTGTVVVQARADTEQCRVRIQPSGQPDLPYPYSLGPYRVLPDPAHSQPGQVLDGFDMSLRRRVWIVVQPPGALATPAARRDLSRKSRLRWLNGRRTADFAWDAYEAPDGQPLFASQSQPRPWRIVRRCLLDLAEEAQLTLQEDDDSSLLFPERVWISGDGGAMLLDFAFPGVENPPQESDGGLAEADKRVIACAFLSRVARRALLGANDPLAGSPLPPELPLPLHASRLLAALADKRCESCEAIVGELGAAARRPDRIGRRRRLLQFAVPSALLAGLVLFGLGGQYSLGRQFEKQHPGYRQVLACLEELRSAEHGKPVADLERRKRDLQIFLAGPLRSVIEDSTATLVIQGIHEPLYDVFGQGMPVRIRKALQDFPNPTTEEVAAAGERLGAEFSATGLRRREIKKGVSIFRASLSSPLALSPLVVLFGFALRGGAMLSLLGIAVVTGRGRAASRWRVLVRSLITWCPFLVPWMLAVSGAWAPVTGPTEPSTYSIARGLGVSFRIAHDQMHFIHIAVFVLGATYAIIRPERSIQDRLAGTYLVPK
jgi:serine/threonine protein kinase